MFDRKRKIADFLFGVQIIGALAFSIPYAYRSLTDVRGSSLVQFGQVAVYLLFHLSLAVGALRTGPNRVNRQLVATYAIWFVLICSILAAAASNPAYLWNDRETAILQVAGVLTVLVLGLTVVAGMKLTDPATKAMFAIAYKSVPQVLLAWKFLAEGASGTPVASVVIGHATILIRIVHIVFMVREAGWDRNRFWLLVSETLNELSWIVATIAWLMA